MHHRHSAVSIADHGEGIARLFGVTPDRVEKVLERKGAHARGCRWLWMEQGEAQDRSTSDSTCPTGLPPPRTASENKGSYIDRVSAGATPS